MNKQQRFIESDSGATAGSQWTSGFKQSAKSTQRECVSPRDISISKISLSTPAQIVWVGDESGHKERLMELGLTVGTIIEVVQRGLWKGPVLLRVRGFVLSLCRCQADTLRVRPLEALSSAVEQ